AITGNLRVRTGDVDRGLAEMESAFAKAYAEGLDGLAAVVAGDLAYSLSVRRARHADAMAWVERGRAAAAGVGDDPAHVSALDNVAGAVELQMGDYDAAAGSFERTIAAREAIGGDHHPSLAIVRSNLCNLFAQRGMFDRAADECMRALEIARVAY